MAKKTGKKAKASWQRPVWKDAGKWLLGLLLFSLIGSGAAWGLLQLQDPNVLPLKVIRIDGDFKHLDRRQLEGAIGRAMGGNFFTVDLDGIREAGLDLAWVDQVTVRRIWPDTLKMTVREEIPLARWGKQQLVNHQGGVFSPLPKEIPQGLPELAGPEGSAAEVVTQFVAMNHQVAGLDLSIMRLNMDARRAWSLVFNQGLELKLGRSQQEERLTRFIRIYRLIAKSEETQRMKRVDLRYTNGVAVLWEERKQQEKMVMTRPLAGMRRETTVKHGGGQA
ncbi:cell division protein FtsQ/DivIB [Candidatus Vondammii sp. HM_W22]|uniref:cell division protein FtsQ/DivIB n=1 Tax=Candidatus Vondammii sp. HM_W22 TaxID=2687299 RepID=UPI001F135AB2|nr:cell division protein FtsQ/DivIB [Candidatus Vondammii sp. HM_W22]